MEEGKQPSLLLSGKKKLEEGMPRPVCNMKHMLPQVHLKDQDSPMGPPQSIWARHAFLVMTKRWLIPTHSYLASL